MRVTSLATCLLFAVLGGSLVPTTLWSQGSFVRGDCDLNGVVNAADIQAIAFYAFAGPHPCYDACTIGNQGGLLAALDLAQFLFEDGPPPAAPYPDCAPDPNPVNSCSGSYCDRVVLSEDSRFVLRVGEHQVVDPAPVEVVVALDNETDVGMVSFSICHDSTEVEVVDVVAGSVAGALPFVSTRIENGGCAVSVIPRFDFAAFDEGVDQEVAVITYNIVGGVGASTALSFCDTIGSSLPIGALVTDQSFIEHRPVTVDGSLTLVEARFRRGDVNGDGVAATLVDALYALNFGFSGGSPVPCLDAGDFNDDGAFSALTDALSILNYAFLGAAPPPAPGVDCGVDPTPDMLDCASGVTCR